MIDPANKNIQRYVDSGDYFRDSLEWYYKKYVSHISIRAYLIILLFVSIVSGLAAISIFNTSTEVRNLALVVNAEDPIKYYPVVKALSTVKEPINLSVARYLAALYVTGREAYKYRDVTGEKGELTTKMIQSMSSRRVFREYSDSTNPEINPDSPLIIYKSFIQRIINIKEVKFHGARSLPDKAVISFEAIEKSDTNESKSNWVAEVSFSMQDLEKKNEKGESELTFTITSYKTYKLN